MWVLYTLMILFVCSLVIPPEPRPAIPIVSWAAYEGMNEMRPFVHVPRSHGRNQTQT